MLIFLIMIIFASLATLASRLSTVLLIQAEIFQSTVVAYGYEQYCYGALNYAIAYLSERFDAQEILVNAGEYKIVCNIWNTSFDGNIRCNIVYTCVEGRYMVDINMYKKDILIKKIKASLKTEEHLAKKRYSCVAIEAF